MPPNSAYRYGQVSTKQLRQTVSLCAIQRMNETVVGRQQVVVEMCAA